MHAHDTHTLTLTLTYIHCLFHEHSHSNEFDIHTHTRTHVQDLKDFARQAGNPIYTKTHDGVGIIEFSDPMHVRCEKVRETERTTERERDVGLGSLKFLIPCMAGARERD